MVVLYRTNKLERTCTDAKVATRMHGSEMAEKIDQRIGELESIDSIEQLLQYKVGGFHALHGDRRHQFAMDLVQPYRLIIEKGGENGIRVVEIEDYH